MEGREGEVLEGLRDLGKELRIFFKSSPEDIFIDF